MSEPLRILILEDQPDDAKLATSELSQGGVEFAARIVETEKDYLAELQSYAPQVILADYRLPGYNGLSALAAAQKLCPETPFIFVSGALGRAIESLRRGATDYVLKEHLTRLGPAVHRALREQAEKRKSHEAEARYRALFEQSPDGIIVLDPESTRFLEFNTAAHRQLGYTREEFAQLSLAEIGVHETPEELRAIVEAVGRAGKRDFETWHRTREGQIRHVHVTAQVIQTSGRPVHHAIVRDITERKQAEQLVRQSERRFRLLFNSGYDAVFVHQGGADGKGPGKFIEVNDVACHNLGYTREELLQLTPLDILAPESLPDIPKVRAKLVAEHSALSEGVHLTKDGRRIPVEISTHVFDLDGKPTRLSMVRDITGRKQAELRVAAFSQLGQGLSAAKTAREAARIIVQAADKLLGWDACSFGLGSGAGDLLDYVLLVDTIDGRRVETSPGHFPMSGFARSTIQVGGQLVLKEKMDQLLPGAEPFGDANRRSASLLYVPVRNGAEVVGVMTIQSYTPGAYDARSLETLQALADHCGGALDRLRIEAAWQTTQERLSHLLTQSPAVIYSLKTDGTTIEPAWVSDNVERLLGYTVAECHGPEGLFAQLHPQERQGVVDGLVQLIAKQQIARDCRVRHKNGKYCWVRDEQRLVCDAQGAPLEIVGSWVDITERKALEEQLRQSQKMEAVGQLAGGVAHDFNNLLAVIRGNAELMLMQESLHTAEGRENLTDVVDASKRAASLTRQLLAFSRKHILQSQPLVLNEVLANLTKMLERVIGENIDLQCHYAGMLPHIQADPGMMEQVILNLVVNARDAMPQGGQLRVAIEAVSLDEAYAGANPEARAGEFVALAVSDTGTGIAPEVLPRIFEPFFTTKEVGKGTGLGLATVYGIVKQHQGWLEVSSRVGEGSTFRVLLPAIASPPGLVAAPELSPALSGGTETILLVEDDQPMRMTTRRVLESKGYQVREAANAREALEQWRLYSAEIALLLTDIIMPEEMTGRDLAERLQQQRPALKVIFMSGYSAEVMGKNTDFLRRTRSHFLQKPCSLRDLLDTVRRGLDELASEGAAGAPGRAK